jgi:hypothetical protein
MQLEQRPKETRGTVCKQCSQIRLILYELLASGEATGVANLLRNVVTGNRRRGSTRETKWNWRLFSESLRLRRKALGFNKTLLLVYESSWRHVPVDSILTFTKVRTQRHTIPWESRQENNCCLTSAVLNMATPTAQGSGRCTRYFVRCHTVTRKSKGLEHILRTALRTNFSARGINEVCFLSLVFMLQSNHSSRQIKWSLNNDMWRFDLKRICEVSI